eukprot:CAMPEP_0183362736 /NCGR_PEP_ID=MMETSP0164_2-20130417/71225_1 /TAXON_ID=221442 /ORGANISM="Coccolithus pelagicus ssp braarudi, Strain PLY182g" /LENGTH=79 /DNA_ID=CAMNT_0025537669 /DNA_START=89 /DNA_END=325 /DNA_ORIENTATION=+
MGSHNGCDASTTREQQAEVILEQEHCAHVLAIRQGLAYSHPKTRVSQARTAVRSAMGDQASRAASQWAHVRSASIHAPP